MNVLASLLISSVLCQENSLTELTPEERAKCKNIVDPLSCADCLIIGTTDIKKCGFKMACTGFGWTKKGCAANTQTHKILCLHGGGQTANNMKKMDGIQDLMDALPSFEFVFASTPESGNVWIRDPPGGKDDPTTDPDWAKTSFDHLDNLVTNDGPFYALLGYSQGSAIIPVYLADRPSNTFDRVILFNGYVPSTHEGLVATLDSAAPLSTPALVFSGGKDPFGEFAPEQASKFSDVLEVESKNVGHEPPSSSDNNFQTIVDFINNSVTKNCQCNQNTVLGLISNTNDGTPFTIVGECDQAAQKKKPEDWTVFCDADGNGEQNGDEESISFTMHKKCKKIDSGSTSISCGDGEDGGEPPVDCKCDAKPKDCPTCDAECLGVDGKNVEIKFTCPQESENAGASKTLNGKCKKIAKSTVNLQCGGGDDGLDCTCESEANSAAAKIGAKAVCTQVNKKKPTYRFFCDENGNDQFDDGETSKTDKNKCKKLSPGKLKC